MKSRSEYNTKMCFSTLILACAVSFALSANANCLDDAKILGQPPGTTLVLPDYYSRIDSNPDFSISATLGTDGTLYLHIISASTNGKRAAFSVEQELSAILDHFSEKTRALNLREKKTDTHKTLFNKRVQAITITLGGYRTLDDYDHVRAVDPVLDTLNVNLQKTHRYKSEQEAVYHGVQNTALAQIMTRGLLRPSDIKILKPTRRQNGYKEVTLRFQKN